MWIFTKFGFFSVTEVKDYGSGKGSVFHSPLPIQPPGTLQVRARVRGDLEELKRLYLPSLSDTVEIAGRDYPYRAFATKEAVASAMYYAAMDIDYGNFKNEVLNEQGIARELLYSDVWSVMYQAERKLVEKAAEHRRYQRSLQRRGSSKSRSFRWDELAAWMRRDPEDDTAPVATQEDLEFPPTEEEVETFSLLNDPELEREVFTWGEESTRPSGRRKKRKKRRRRGRDESE